MDAIIIVTLFLFPGLMIWAAIYDITTMTIPNMVSLILTILFIVFGVLTGISVWNLTLHASAAMIVLVCAFGMFAMNWIGGGDAKLASATALWFGLSETLDYLLLAAIFGGVLTLLILQFRMISLPHYLSAFPWIARLHDKKTGIPYGVALAGSALVLMPYSQVFSRAFLPL